MEPALEKVFAHLRQIAEIARATSKAGDFASFRAAIERYNAVAPETAEVHATTSPVSANGVPAEWILAPGADPNRRLLYIHGGSWMAGSIESYRPLAARISDAAKCAVLLIGYRLAPENPFPAGLDDCAAAYQWMLDNGPTGEQAADSSFVAGDSAGGNLTLALLLALRDKGQRLPRAAVAISPATDLTGSGDSVRTRADVDPIIDGARVSRVAAIYTNGRDLIDPLISPLFGDLFGLPPLLIQVGDAETLLDDSRRFALKAKDTGVDVTLQVWPEMPHVWHIFAPFLPESVRAIERIGAFLRRF